MYVIINSNQKGMIDMFSIKNDELSMYEINNEYIEYLRKFDKRVSMKGERKFYGILVQSNNVDYYIPFTSKVNKKTNSKLTINIKDRGNNIAKLLLNNMIPVKEDNTKLVDVKTHVQGTYFESELRYLRTKKVREELLRKINNIFDVLNDETDTDYKFFKNICCDFKILEKKCEEYYKQKNEFIVFVDIIKEICYNKNVRLKKQLKNNFFKEVTAYDCR